MICEWNGYINILPYWMRQEVDRLGKETLQELRVRIGQPPLLIFQQGSSVLRKEATKEDVSFIINTASEYSPWTAHTVGQGFLTAPGGHRIGICGICTLNNGKVCGISQPTSLCIRVARDFCGIAKQASHLLGSILIIGQPGSGKTTLLRDLIRWKAQLGMGSVAVVDDRQEIFPNYKGKNCFCMGGNVDVISGCPKNLGIEMVLRSMNPSWIAVDEITAQEDCDTLLHAGWCGVNLLATAHAGSILDLKTRPVYKSIISYSLFSHILVLQRDKSWTLERM